MKKLIGLVKNQTFKISILTTVISIGIGVGAYFLSSYLDQKPKSGVAGIETSVTPISQTPNPSSVATPTPTISPKVTSTPVVVYKDVPSTPSTIPTQATKIDSATQIELCKTKAERHKTQVMTALVLVFDQANPALIELGKASTIYETKIVAIKYGMIKEGDLEANFTVVSNYLTNTHDWAVKQVADYMGTVNAKGDLAYNDYYVRCLNGEN